MKLATSEKQLLKRLRAVLDKPKGRYRELNGARNLGEYLGRDRSREDEELLTEPILGDALERLLGGALSRMGLRVSPMAALLLRYEGAVSLGSVGSCEAPARRR